MLAEVGSLKTSFHSSVRRQRTRGADAGGNDLHIPLDVPTFRKDEIKCAST